MKFFKKLFENKSSGDEVINDAPLEQEDNSVIDKNICQACNLEIHGEQKSVKIAGKRYHVKPCWRSIQKLAKKQVFG